MQAHALYGAIKASFIQGLTLLVKAQIIQNKTPICEDVSVVYVLGLVHVYTERSCL